jgi:death on curing protein
MALSLSRAAIARVVPFAAAGLRDEGLLESALARPLQLAAYGEPDVAALAASYGYGLARNHPFVDGNKLTANDVACVLTMLDVASGQITEPDFVDWLRRHAAPI